MIDQEEIHNQLFSEYPEERRKALKQLKDSFSLLPDKQKAWNDLHRLTIDEDGLVRRAAAYALGSAFSQVPDKQQAWNDLIKLTNNEYRSEKYTATYTLGSAFYDVPDKQQAWNDLIKLTSGEDDWVRNEVAFSLGSVFSQVPDKQKAWNDLHKLTTIEDDWVRSGATDALGSAFSYMPDKQKAWNDLHRLTNDKNWSVRSSAANALGSAFSYMPDKQKAWNDLHRLICDESSYARSSAAEAIGSAFSYIPDKQKAWNDLHKLTSDEDSSVRTYANHSLGKVSIFKASQSEKEEEYKKELEIAIAFFEKAAQESSDQWLNPSQFCLPFYRSFHTIIFKRQESKEEVDKYLEEAKDAIEGSKSKELLFEAVENLAEALKEVQSMENQGLEAKKGELNFYRQYCNRAAELMIDTEKTAPFATIAMRKGLPIFDRNLKELIEEIKRRANIACKELQETPKAEIACTINREVQDLEIGSQEEMKQRIQDLAYVLKSKVADPPENEYVLNKIELMRHERDLTKQYETLLFVITQIPTTKAISEKELDHKLLKLDHKLDLIYDKNVSIEAKLDLIQKELDKGLEKLDIISLEVGGNEGELIQKFSKKVLELTEKGDKEALQSFLEEVLKNENVLIEEIENSSAPLEEKEESKSSVSKIRSVLDKVKHPIKSFGKDVTKEIIVSYAAEEIVKLVFQLVSIATLGVPIPPQIQNLLKNIVKELNK